ncbi:hypothetical protein CLOM_g13230 [Closterium sp. NIES-68]|nr:hypothetical protein CLOM_g13230 [Closterium sp. NIES-68]GJP67115.1 hypothetical protein CLOP_g23978 [Closterium sp. NIES-67]
MKRPLYRGTDSIAYTPRKRLQVTRIESGNQQQQIHRFFARPSQATDSLTSFRPSSPRTVLSAISLTLSCSSSSLTIESNTESSFLQAELEVTSPAIGAVADKGCSVQEFTDLNIREEEGDCSDPARDYTERLTVLSEGTAAIAVSTKRDNNEGDDQGMWKVAKRRCVAFDCVTLPPLPSLEAPRMQPDVRKLDIPDPRRPPPISTGRSTASRSPSPVPYPLATPLTNPLTTPLMGPLTTPLATPQPCRASTELPSPLPGPVTRFKRQRPPTLDIPRKGCFTSSPAGTPDSAAEDALDGVVEVAESGAGFAVACKRGRKPVMEDTYQALVGFGGRESDAFFGVFDGHGGTAAAKFAASELASHVAAAARRRGGQASEAALEEGYLETDRRFLDQNVSSGTSCLNCWATPGRLFLAHAGDCRAVLVKGGKGVPLTEDHRATREDEQTRIARLGGFVDTATGMPRVQGILAVTRGIGDAHLKAFITPQPDVAQVPVGRDCSALILASDGLWDVVPTQEAADVVTACITAALAAPPALSEPPASVSPPCKRARKQVSRGWSAELAQERGREMERETEFRMPYHSPLGTPPCTPRSHTTATTTPPCTPHSRATTTPLCTPHPRVTTTSTNTRTPAMPRRHLSPSSSQRSGNIFLSPRSRAPPPFAPPWLDTPFEDNASVGANAVAVSPQEETVAAGGSHTVAAIQQGSVAAVVPSQEASDSGVRRKAEGILPCEMARGGEGVMRAVDGEVLLRACEALVGMAATRGSRDDITVMLVSLAPFAESAS